MQKRKITFNCITLGLIVLSGFFLISCFLCTPISAIYSENELSQQLTDSVQGIVYTTYYDVDEDEIDVLCFRSYKFIYFNDNYFLKL